MKIFRENLILKYVDMKQAYKITYRQENDSNESSLCQKFKIISR